MRLPWTMRSSVKVLRGLVVYHMRYASSSWARKLTSEPVPLVEEIEAEPRVGIRREAVRVAERDRRPADLGADDVLAIADGLAADEAGAGNGGLLLGAGPGRREGYRGNDHDAGLHGYRR